MRRGLRITRRIEDSGADRDAVATPLGEGDWTRASRLKCCCMARTTTMRVMRRRGCAPAGGDDMFSSVRRCLCDGPGRAHGWSCGTVRSWKRWWYSIGCGGLIGRDCGGDQGVASSDTVIGVPTSRLRRGGCAVWLASGDSETATTIADALRSARGE